MWDGIAIGDYQLTETVPFGYRATLPVIPGGNRQHRRHHQCHVRQPAVRQPAGLQVRGQRRRRAAGRRGRTGAGHHRDRALPLGGDRDEADRRGRLHRLERHPGRQLPHYRDLARGLAGHPAHGGTHGGELQRHHRCDLRQPAAGQPAGLQVRGPRRRRAAGRRGRTGAGHHRDRALPLGRDRDEADRRGRLHRLERHPRRQLPHYRDLARGLAGHPAARRYSRR